jgi:transcriptional regulator with XRE-family HTH domain
VPQSKARRSQESFGQRLARLRRLRGLTQRALAAESGVSQRMVAYYETHDATAPGDVVASLASALKVPLDELLGLKPAAPEAPSSTAELNLWRKFRDLQNLPERKRRAVLRMVDEFLDGYSKKSA